MKIEINDGRCPIVFCDDIPCDMWASQESRCLSCPFKKLIESHADSINEELIMLGYHE